MLPQWTSLSSETSKSQTCFLFFSLLKLNPTGSHVDSTTKWLEKPFIPPQGHCTQQEPPCWFSCFLFCLLQPILQTFWSKNDLGIAITLFSHFSGFVFHIELHPSSLRPSILLLTLPQFSSCTILPHPYHNPLAEFLAISKHTCLREFSCALLSSCNTVPFFSCLHDHCLVILFVLSLVASSERPPLNGLPPLRFCLHLWLISFKVHFTNYNNVLIQCFVA